MPIYEFYCSHCHTLFNFFSRAIDTTKSPACPRCGTPGLERRPSTFAISKNRPEPATDADGMPDIDDARLERALAALESEAAGLDENDPRQAARLMRRLTEATGLPLNESMEEALRRMESGEDPDAVEAEMGDALDDPFASGESPKSRLRRFVSRHLPPRVDPRLYEM